jgi:short-subunit dehydrogenase
VRHALITGAAGAIGGAIARALSGYRLTLVDVDERGLAAIARDLSAAERVWDLADTAGLEARYQELIGSEGEVDLLVNCAGIMDMRSIAGFDWRAGERLLAIDLLSPLRLMHLALPGMLARHSGGVINVSSMAGITPLRGGAFYGAAKAGLAMASEVARIELAERGVHVLTVYPGPVKSTLEKNARDQLRATFYRDVIPTGDPQKLARLVCKAFAAKEPRVAYPSLYDVAFSAPRIASWITSRFSPRPTA